MKYLFIGISFLMGLLVIPAISEVVEQAQYENVRYTFTEQTFLSYDLPLFIEDEFLVYVNGNLVEHDVNSWTISIAEFNIGITVMYDGDDVFVIQNLNFIQIYDLNVESITIVYLNVYTPNIFIQLIPLVYVGVLISSFLVVLKFTNKED